MPNLRFLLRVSRPRFWFYTLGPFLIGLVSAVADKRELLDWRVFVFILFFTLPANLLIYGINDIFDYETDKLNPKKAGYEILVQPKAHRSLIFWICLLNVPFVLAVCFFSPTALPSLAGFLFFSIFYSAPPVRAKVFPFLDSIFNVLYFFPAAFAYQMLTGSFPPVPVVFAAGLWTMAMHAYSAIPDIKADKEAGLHTIATQLGDSGTHLFCMTCFAISFAIGAMFIPPSSRFAPILGVAALLYLVLIFVSYRNNQEEDLSIYRFFPYLNTASGFLLFWSIAWPKFF
ncbi:MAG: prenyltransferase [Acidobacteriota bacterium]